ncbi:hypothetical protein N2152v2_009699 [Parachlorella kessleri]
MAVSSPVADSSHGLQLRLPVRGAARAGTAHRLVHQRRLIVKPTHTIDCGGRPVVVIALTDVGVSVKVSGAYRGRPNVVFTPGAGATISIKVPGQPSIVLLARQDATDDLLASDVLARQQHDAGLPGHLNGDGGIGAGREDDVGTAAVGA